MPTVNQKTTFEVEEIETEGYGEVETLKRLVISRQCCRVWSRTGNCGRGKMSERIVSIKTEALGKRVERSSWYYYIFRITAEGATGRFFIF